MIFKKLTPAQEYSEKVTNSILKSENLWKYKALAKDSKVEVESELGASF